MRTSLEFALQLARELGLSAATCARLAAAIESRDEEIRTAAEHQVEARRAAELLDNILRQAGVP